VVQSGTTIGHNVFVGSGVFIGKNCRIQGNVFIPTGVCIEDDVFIGPGVTFTNNRYPFPPFHNTPQRTRIHSGAIIGAGAVILPVIIGKRAVIGAGATVTKDVGEEDVLMGNAGERRWIGDRYVCRNDLPGGTR
jgi:acetyltransferase-like isoleucine patch superfamily enzyme